MNAPRASATPPAAPADRDLPSRVTEGARRRPRPAVRWALAVATAMLVALPACTGSGTTAAPIVLFVAGDDGGTATVRAFETLLPPDPARSDEPLVERPELQRTLDGTDVIDVAAVRDGQPALYLLLRDDDGADGTERLVRFDLSSLDPDDSASMPDDPEPVLDDLDTLLVELDVLAGDDPLCATGMTLTGDASWLGLLHDPRACRPTSSNPPVVIALELAPAAPAQRRIGPPELGTADVAAVPTFFGSGDDARLAWIRATGVVRAWSPFVAGAGSEDLGTIDLGSSAAAIGRSSTGLAVASGTDVRFLSSSDDGAGPVWSLDDAGTVRAVVDADTLPGTATLVLGTDGLALVSDLDQDPDPDRIHTASTAPDAVAVIGPYGFAFVVSGSQLRAYDALTATVGESGLGGAVATRDLGSSTASALDWAFTAASPAP